MENEDRDKSRFRRKIMSKSGIVNLDLNTRHSCE